jgi:adenine-specific DNA-methyltransferase
MDEVLGEDNFVNTIIFKKKSSTTPTDPINDYVLWYSKKREYLKIRQLFTPRKRPGEGSKMTALLWRGGTILRKSEYNDSDIDDYLKKGAEWGRVDYPIVSQHPSKTRSNNYQFRGNS